jgi:murein hydrolase activator
MFIKRVIAKIIKSRFRLISATVLLLVLITLLLPYNAGAQQNEKERLQRDKIRIEQEIEYTNKLLSETQQTKQTSLNQLTLLNKQIRQREELLRNIDATLANLEKQINQSSDTIQFLKSELQRFKNEYARMIVAAHKHSNAQQKLMFVFSSNDFNQAYKRIKYLQQYSAYRRAQADKIQQTQLELTQKHTQLELQRAEKLNLRIASEREKDELSQQHGKQNQSVQNLSKKEKELLATLRENERALNRLQKAIEDIIAEEIRLAREAAKKEGKTVHENFALTPEEVLISNNFAANKGKLPWPSERGIIAGTFGEHPHPVLKGIKTRNNGIDIITHEGAEARAVFEGVVSNVLSIPSLNNVVIIKHGEFLTVYSNLDQLFVKPGDKIALRQRLGVIHTDTDEARTRLHFEIWKGKEIQDPEYWIARSSAIQ